MISLAIGVWLYETSPVSSRQSHDINKEMLKAFGVNTTNMNQAGLSPFHNKSYNPFKAFQSESVPFASGSNLNDFSWLV